MPVMALEIDVVVRFCGRRKRTAASDQYPVHTTSAVTEPPTPDAEAEESTPTAASSGSRPVGHASSPSMAYMNTEPGAPVRALALPVRTIPIPSPSTQTPKAQAKESAKA